MTGFNHSQYLDKTWSLKCLECDIPASLSIEKGIFTVTCNTCGKTGHPADKIDINLKALSKAYNRFLMGNDNVGCPCLSTALSKIIGGVVTVGTFNDDPHCWVVHENRIYDLNNKIGRRIYLIISDIDDAIYNANNQTVTEFHEELGLSSATFEKWTKEFQKSMQEEK